MRAGSTFKYIAFYDLDHTILVDNSATHLINEARKRGIMSEKHFRHAIWLSILYKLGIGNSTKMIVRMLTWLTGLNEELIKQLCVEVFKEQIIHKIRPEILTTLEGHRSRQGAIVILSSASEPICQPITEYLKMDDMICSRLDSDKGLLTGKTIGNLVYAKEKRTRLLSYCKDHEQNPADAYYYGDSYTDYHVMNAVGHPVAVDPDKKLCRIALENKWPILVRDRA
jgi:putative phosphoserine phosphatase/1-acylglycerol-3-phosphate O-acyltransferase